MTNLSSTIEGMELSNVLISVFGGELENGKCMSMASPS